MFGISPGPVNFYWCFEPLLALHQSTGAQSTLLAPPSLIFCTKTLPPHVPPQAPSPRHLRIPTPRNGEEVRGAGPGPEEEGGEEVNSATKKRRSPASPMTVPT